MKAEQIYHITTSEDWASALENGQYECASLSEEGFIHFSRKEQVITTANRYYQNVHGLLLLQANTSRTAAQLKNETAPSGEVFPHLYGSLNLDSITSVFSFEPDSDGIFRSFPEAGG
jgi:uncharacterized protein (DUF952 family)